MDAVDILRSCYRLKDGIDVYRRPLDAKTDQITFYKINSREETRINASNAISLFLSCLDGKETALDILQKNNLSYSADDVEKLIVFLESKGIVSAGSLEKIIHDDEAIRFDRQINFFDNWSLGVPGAQCQSALFSAHVAIIGIGAIGGGIAVQLARAGVRNLTLMDYKVVSESNMMRHQYFRQKYLGLRKTEALRDYLLQIDRRMNVRVIDDALRPETDLNSILKDADFVINTADEPYIGYTSIKLGRHFWDKGIPLYVAGGFDAHLMSTGELIVKGETPCVDCCSESFSLALKDWKPKYVSDGDGYKSESRRKPASLSPGLASRGLFSASYAAMEVISYLSGAGGWRARLSHRGEFLPNKGDTTWFSFHRQVQCRLCNVG